LHRKFLADENIPFQVIQALRDAGYETATLAEVARPGIRNDQLAELSIKLKRITRDADFTYMKQSLMTKIKVIYVKLSGDPNNIAQQVVNYHPTSGMASPI
jgi:predicted nuclease of predicted toxin-antitoxin system